MKMPIDPRLDVGGGRFAAPSSPLMATLILQRRLWVVLWCLLATITTVLYLLPNAGPPGQANIDKICHLIAFGSLGFSAFLGAGRLRVSTPILVSLVLAMSLEWLQSYVPGREYSILDWTANLVGLALGIGVAAIFRAAAVRAAGDLT